MHQILIKVFYVFLLVSLLFTMFSCTPRSSDEEEIWYACKEYDGYPSIAQKKSYFMLKGYQCEETQYSENEDDDGRASRFSPVKYYDFTYEIPYEHDYAVVSAFDVLEFSTKEEAQEYYSYCKYGSERIPGNTWIDIACYRSLLRIDRAVIRIDEEGALKNIVQIMKLPGIESIPREKEYQTIYSDDPAVTSERLLKFFSENDYEVFDHKNNIFNEIVQITERYLIQASNGTCAFNLLLFDPIENATGEKLNEWLSFYNLEKDGFSSVVLSDQYVLYGPTAEIVKIIEQIQ